MITPRFNIWDTFRFGKQEFLVISIDRGMQFLTDGGTLCYYTYDLSNKKVRVFSVEGVDRKQEQFYGRKKADRCG